MSEPLATYWDSCVFIDALRKTPGRWEHIRYLEDDARSGGSYIYTSTLTIAEVVRCKDDETFTDAERRLIANYFTHSFVKIIPVDRIVARAAADIVRVHRLKPPDAIHVATALRAKCAVLYTYDGVDGGGLLAKHDQIGTPTLPIKRPGEFGQMQFA